ncbi:MAG: HD domain-containing protein [Deferribacteraceae bacterium]|nr:HD domain-containing protein [Deferribacteraceae bacterium]
MQSVIKRLKMDKMFDTSQLLQFITFLVNCCKEDEDRLIALTWQKDSANYIYAHPVNVCIYSLSIGCKLSFTDKQLTYLGMAALLHDVGEIKLPERMRGKAAKFTESELSAMRQHPKLGYELLKRFPYIHEDVLMGVLHHHERIDGSGYPSGHIGRFIHPLGKIIAVAEIFDAMTSDRHSATSIPATDVLKVIYSKSGKHYEPEVVNALITITGMYPVGSLVRLNGGQLAVVLKKNMADLSKPEVLVITDTNAQPIAQYTVNLLGDKYNRQIMYAENASQLKIDTNKYLQSFIAIPKKKT